MILLNEHFAEEGSVKRLKSIATHWNWIYFVRLCKILYPYELKEIKEVVMEDLVKSKIIDGEGVKKVSGKLNIDIYVDCPHCESYEYLSSYEELFEESNPYEPALRKSSYGCKDLFDELAVEYIKCKSCGKPFYVEEIDW